MSVRYGGDPVRHHPVGLDADPGPYRAINHRPDTRTIEVIDQTMLPHALVRITIDDSNGAALAIRKMIIRGAPLIGAVAAYGLALALDTDASDAGLAQAHGALLATRPTAVNLRWALDRVRDRVAVLPPAERANQAWTEADRIVAEDIHINRAIGHYGHALLRGIAERKPGPINVMTHCNAGALATCGWGTATAAVFRAHSEGLPVHVWISETRPRLQGANLTAWECDQRGVPHTLFSDSAGALLMRRGDVDIVLVGADRVAANGDTCNKIGTYGKALAAADNRVPFYVAMPSPTLDAQLASGDGIPIEARGPEEVLAIHGRDAYGQLTSVEIAPPGTRAVNYAFDVTPARLVAGLVTERGVIDATTDAIARAFPERFGR
ncbi:MAG: S-methyl-5-thioribose-1-phosphate isomerase [Casimicrobiaceae bacterium]